MASRSPTPASAKSIIWSGCSPGSSSRSISKSLDDQPSDLIFLLLAPDSADADSLKALARISRLLRDPGLRQRLRQEVDRDAVYRMLTQKPECHAA